MIIYGCLHQRMDAKRLGEIENLFLIYVWYTHLRTLMHVHVFWNPK